MSRICNEHPELKELQKIGIPRIRAGMLDFREYLDALRDGIHFHSEWNVAQPMRYR